MMMTTRNSGKAMRALPLAIALVIPASLTEPVTAGPVTKGATVGALGGAFVTGVTGGNPLAGAAVGAATGAVVGLVQKESKKK
jgi:uncharacterized membrane protein